MDAVLVIVGVALVVVALADLVNTLVTTSTSYARLWPTRLVYTALFGLVRAVASRLPERSRMRARLLATFGPLLLIVLLAFWVSLQVVGFGLVWAGVGGVSTLGDLGEAMYYSGVVLFTIGFGAIVPETVVARVGALIEAFAGVVTTALVIGYLPALFAAYSERERRLMVLDHGSQEQITPVSLLLA